MKKSKLLPKSFNYERIIGKKIENKMMFLKVAWTGYSIDQSTWEPVRNFDDIKELKKQIELFDQTCNDFSVESTATKNNIEKGPLYFSSSTKIIVRNTAATQVKNKKKKKLLQKRSNNKKKKINKRQNRKQ